MMLKGKYGSVYPGVDENQTVDNDLRYLNIAQLKDKQEQGKTDPYPSRIWQLQCGNIGIQAFGLKLQKISEIIYKAWYKIFW